MGDYIFLFDLDSTITAREILPEISRTVGKEKEMREITEKTMQGIVPFQESFLRRVELLKDVAYYHGKGQGNQLCGNGSGGQVFHGCHYPFQI